MVWSKICHDQMAKYFKFTVCWHRPHYMLGQPWKYAAPSVCPFWGHKQSSNQLQQMQSHMGGKVVKIEKLTIVLRWQCRLPSYMYLDHHLDADKSTII